jgi:hypothetical protein
MEVCAMRFLWNELVLGMKEDATFRWIMLLTFGLMFFFAGLVLFVKCAYPVV